MIEILPESTQNCIGFKISGEVEAEDYEKLLPIMDEAIAAHGKINLLVVIEDYEGFDGLDAAKADFRFGTQQYRQVEKAAFVCEKKWFERAIKLLAPFTRRTHEKTFEPDELEPAWAWVLEDD
jgi:hypothetical protein